MAYDGILGLVKHCCWLCMVCSGFPMPKLWFSMEFALQFYDCLENPHSNRGFMVWPLEASGTWILELWKWSEDHQNHHKKAPDFLVFDKIFPTFSSFFCHLGDLPFQLPRHLNLPLWASVPSHPRDMVDSTAFLTGLCPAAGKDCHARHGGDTAMSSQCNRNSIEKN